MYTGSLLLNALPVPPELFGHSGQQFLLDQCHPLESYSAKSALERYGQCEMRLDACSY